MNIGAVMPALLLLLFASALVVGAGLVLLVIRLVPRNRLWRKSPPQLDLDGFSWVDCSDHENSVLSFIRQNKERTSRVLVILNLTPVVRYHYRVGLPQGGFWREALNSDAQIYGGGNVGNRGAVKAEAYRTHNQPFSAPFTLPPLGVVAFVPQRA